MDVVLTYSHLQAMVEGGDPSLYPRIRARDTFHAEFAPSLLKSLATLVGGDLVVATSVFEKSFNASSPVCKAIRDIASRHILAKRTDLCLGMALKFLAMGNHRGVLEILEELATFDRRNMDLLSKKFPQLGKQWGLQEEISLEGFKEEIASIKKRNSEYLYLSKALKTWVVVDRSEPIRLLSADRTERAFLSGIKPGELSFISQNISNLPNIFDNELFKSVTELDVSNTSLRELNLRPFPHLKTLRAVKAPLKSIDIRWNKELETVDLSGCSLMQLPLGLDFVTKSHPRLISLDLTGNPILMRDYSIQRKEHWIRDIARIQVGYSNIYRKLTELLPEGNIYEMSQFLCKGPISTLDEVYRWINRLKEWMVHYSEVEQEALGKLVSKFFALASRNLQFREQLIAIIGEASRACIDGLTLSLMHLTRAELTLQIDSKNPMSAVKVLTIFVKLDLLERIAKEKIRRLHEGPENVEDHDGVNAITRVERDILLMYPAHLRERLGLPFVIGHTQFANRTHVTEEDLTVAGNDVEAVVSDPDLLHAEFIKNPIWEELMQLHYPEQYRDILLRAQGLSDHEDYSGSEALKKEGMIGLSKLSATAPVSPISDKDLLLLRSILRLNINEKKQKVMQVLGVISKYVGRDIQSEMMTKYNEGLLGGLPPLTPGADDPMIGIDRHLLLHIVKGLLTTPPEARAGDPLVRRVRSRVEE